MSDYFPARIEGRAQFRKFANGNKPIDISTCFVHFSSDRSGGGNRHRIRVLVSSLFIADPKLSSQQNSYHLCIRPARHASPSSLLYIVSLIRKLIRLVIKGTQKLSQTMRWQGLSAHLSGSSVSCLFQSYCAMGIRTYKKTPTSDCGDDLFESRLMTAQS